MLLIIIANIILISLAFIGIELIDNNNKEEKAIERYCQIECRSNMRHSGFHN